MRVVIEAKGKESNASYNDITKKYGFSSVKTKGKKFSTSDGVMSVTFMVKPFQYFVNILGGYQGSLDTLKKLEGSVSKAHEMLKEIKDSIEER